MTDRPPIVVNIIGGLGNQMFQYACGRAVSLRNQSPLHLSTGLYQGYSLHSGFELARVFGIDVPQATHAELRQLLGWQSRPTLRRLLGRPAMRWAVGSNWTNEPYHKYWKGIEDIVAPRYLHGYWQSERYFEDAAELLRKDFTFRMHWNDDDLALRSRIKAQPSASIHVRRGDYLHPTNERRFATCGLDYYRGAVQLLRQRVPDLHLFAFSDEPDWVEEQLGGEFAPIEVVWHNSGERSANDMRLMSQADHHIIANSSFSWWGAWLNACPQKIVVAPRQWFLDGTDERDLIPAAWVRL